MEVSTKFRQQSVNGISFSVLKSALQKYVRRGEYEKGMITLGYLSAFNEDDREGLSVRTNTINRLIVMMSEEVSLHELELPKMMYDLYQKWLKCRQDIDRSSAIWMEMFHLLCLSRKCRVISDLKTVYFLPPNPQTRPEQHVEYLEKFNISEPEIRDGEDITKSFLTALKAKSETTLFYLRFVYPPPPKKTDKWIWDVVSQSCKRQVVREQIKALEYFYRKMTHMEKPIYLYHAILLTLHEKNVDTRISLPRNIDEKFVKTYRTRAESFGGKFDDYVYDKHVGRMNKEKKTTYTFATEGAFIPDQDERFFNSVHRDFYVECRRGDEEI